MKQKHPKVKFTRSQSVTESTQFRLKRHLCKMYLIADTIMFVAINVSLTVIFLKVTYNNIKEDDIKLSWRNVLPYVSGVIFETVRQASGWMSVLKYSTVSMRIVIFQDIVYVIGCVVGMIVNLTPSHFVEVFSLFVTFFCTEISLMSYLYCSLRYPSSYKKDKDKNQNKEPPVMPSSNQHHNNNPLFAHCSCHCCRNVAFLVEQFGNKQRQHPSDQVVYSTISSPSTMEGQEQDDQKHILMTTTNRTFRDSCIQDQMLRRVSVV